MINLYNGCTCLFESYLDFILFLVWTAFAIVGVIKVIEDYKNNKKIGSPTSILERRNPIY